MGEPPDKRKLININPNNYFNLNSTMLSAALKPFVKPFVKTFVKPFVKPCAEESEVSANPANPASGALSTVVVEKLMEKPVGNELIDFRKPPDIGCFNFNLKPSEINYLYESKFVVKLCHAVEKLRYTIVSNEREAAAPYAKWEAEWEVEENENREPPDILSFNFNYEFKTNYLNVPILTA